MHFTALLGPYAMACNLLQPVMQLGLRASGDLSQPWNGMFFGFHTCRAARDAAREGAVAGERPGCSHRMWSPRAVRSACSTALLSPSRRKQELQCSQALGMHLEDIPTCEVPARAQRAA